jgi:hypothetical protein
MGEGGSRAVRVVHPAFAGLLAPRARMPAPFYERVETDVALRRLDEGAFEPARAGVGGAGYGLVRFEGGFWRSLSVRANRNGGPRTAVDEADFVGFLNGRASVSSAEIAGLLRHTPLVASRQLPERGDLPPWSLERGEPVPEGHRIVGGDRVRAAARVADFIGREVASTGHRILVRVHPVVLVGPVRGRLALLPDPDVTQALAVPPRLAAAGLAAMAGDGEARDPPAVDEEVLRAGEEGGSLREAVNLLARAASAWMGRAERSADAASRAAAREAFGPLRGDWRERCRYGGIDAYEGEALVRGLVAAAEALERPEGDADGDGNGDGGRARTFARIARAARDALVPGLRQGSPPSEEDLAALSLL